MNDLKLDSVIPVQGNWSQLKQQAVMLPFSDEAIEFTQQLSAELLGASNRFPETVALGYWLRKANIQRLKQQFTDRQEAHLRLARGTAFHIAPANVDTIFIYSWLLSLLVGNSNVVRLPSSDSPQLSLLMDAISRTLELPQFRSIRERTLLVRYGHDDAINREFSHHCDLRVIWGGDQTIQQFRQLPIPASAREICFVDKFSLVLMDAETVCKQDDLSKLVKGFYNDAFGFGQMACSSPRLVVWLGSEFQVAQAQTKFWQDLTEQVQQQPPEIPLAARMEKLVNQYALAIEGDISIANSASAFINRSQLPDLSDLPIEQHCGGGLFYEASIESLDELAPIMSRKIQTLGVHGVTAETIAAFIHASRCSGIDRVVPIGNALNFDAHWDGYDLLAEMTREVVLDL